MLYKKVSAQVSNTLVLIQRMQIIQKKELWEFSL